MHGSLVGRVWRKKTKTPQLSDNEILVINKSDLSDTKSIPDAIHISAKTGFGIDTLISVIKEKIAALTSNTESSVAVNNRTMSLLVDAASELKNALETPADNYDIFSEHTRRAADSIGKILGTITATEVMDATFGQLCLGK